MTTTTTRYETDLAEEVVELVLDDASTYTSALSAVKGGNFTPISSAATGTSRPTIGYTLSGRTFTFSIVAPTGTAGTLTALYGISTFGVIKGHA